jgi:hypothetical protein
LTMWEWCHSHTDDHSRRHWCIHSPWKLLSNVLKWHLRQWI